MIYKTRATSNTNIT